MPTTDGYSAVDKRAVFNSWANTSLRHVVQDIFAACLGDTGLSLGTIGYAHIEEFIVNGLTVRQCFDHLARLAVCRWSVDDSGHVQFK